MNEIQPIKPESAVTAKETAAIPAATKARKDPPSVATKARPVPQISPSKTKIAEIVRNEFQAFVAAGTRPEDFDQNPDAWALLPNQELYNKFTLICLDETWIAEYVVFNVPVTNAKLTSFTELPPRSASIEARIPAGYSIRQGKAGEEPWIVTRDSDGTVMNLNKHHKSHEDALRYLKDLSIFRGSDTTYVP